MAATLVAAASRLRDVLSAENAALLALDVPGAASLLDEKLAAARGLAEVSALRPAARQTAETAGLALQLRDLAQENRRLLERAILVQGRVLDMVARAARQDVAQSSGRYGAGGAAGGATDRCAVAMTLQVQA